ncbi:MAG: glycosyltransferase family 4 protein [Erysipelotrichaceae bacterium]|nr:glycosyltransferase family 4 protein [Erysipelotrichaceae bacterium]
MKIVIITNHSYMLYQFRRELIHRLQEDNEVVLLMPFVGHENDFDGCKTIHTDIDRRGINPLTDLKLMRTYKRLLKQEKPDLVMTYSIKPNIYGGLICQSLHIPYFANVQGLGTAFESKYLSVVVTMLYKRALQKVQKVFFENKENAQEFINRNIVSINKIKVLNGAGVNLQHYAYHDYPHDDVIHYIFVGRIMKEKGIDEIIYTAKKMKELYQDKVVFDLVGFFEDEYKETIEHLQKENIINFYGFQQDVRPYIIRSHCLMLPSYHEGMANTILEASAMGRPVIVSNIPGCKEGMIDNESGYLVEVKNKEDLFDKVNQFYQLPLDKKIQMGIKARELMEDVFDKEKVVEETYKELIPWS